MNSRPANYPRLVRLLAVVLLANGACLAADPTPPATKPRTLTQVTQVRALTREDASFGVPVKLKGVVTWQSGKDDSFVISDGASGILVRRVGDRGKSVWEGDVLPKSDSEPGALLEVEGITDAGGYAPHVLALHYKRVGTAPLPKSIAIEQLSVFGGTPDGQRVKVAVVVQAMTPPTATTSGILTVWKQDRIFPVQVERWDGMDAAELVDATVKVEGIFAPSYNLRAEMIDLRIKLMSREDIEMMKPSPGDPFLGTAVRLDRLQRYRYSQYGVDPHRKVSEGLVTFSAPNQFFFIQDGATGVRVQSPTTAVHVGQHVQVAGFVGMSRLVASMYGTVVRNLPSAPMPEPRVVTIEEILHPKRAHPTEVENDSDGRLIRIRGILRRLETKGDKGPWRMELESDHKTFQATLLEADQAGAATANAWKEGSYLELTGVAELTFAMQPDRETPAITDLHLWLRGPGDVHVLHRPPWWTSTRLAGALVFALLVLLVAGGWIFALRRAVRLRTKRLEEVMRLHRNSELEFQAASQERLRLAADLHDGLQQMIAGAAFRLEAAVDQLPDIPPEAQEELVAARRALLHTQTGLRDCLWGLRNLDEGPDDFTALLRHAVSSIEHWPGSSVVVDSQGEPFELSRDVMGNLLLLMQEAVGNAFRHGHAGLVHVQLDYGADGLEVLIDDDGVGFEPDSALGTREGHFGLQGMRERMRRLGGTMEIVSAPGHGTRVRAYIPRANAGAIEGEGVVVHDVDSQLLDQ
jgi:signal transduction histidine kinase